jgi:ABC-2 type transport system permease protein
MSLQKKIPSIGGTRKVQLLLVVGILVMLNIIGNYLFTHIDLTEEKRFTLTNATVQQLKSLDDIVFIDVLLDGEFPAGFKRLQRETRELLDGFRNNSGFLEYQFTDPSKGTNDDINKRRAQLAKDSIFPVNLKLMENGEKTEKLIYPFAIVNYKNRKFKINLLENEIPGVNPDEILNKSVSLLEYKFSNAIQKLRLNDKPNVIFVEGHGELPAENTIDIENTLRQFYDVGRIPIDSVVAFPVKDVNVMVIAKPLQEFDDKSRFKIDQYIMNGGRVLWLIDKFAAALDSLATREVFMPTEIITGLDEMLYKYGARIEPNVVMDLESSHIPLVTGKVGNAPQFEMFTWYYNPIAAPKSDHPIVKGLDRTEFRFASRVDTIKTKTPVKKTTILNSSIYGREQFSPMRISLEICREKQDPKIYNKPNIPLGLLLEGVFPSFYENRVTADMMTALDEIKMPFVPKSKPTKMVVFGDGDLIRNDIDFTRQMIIPLGMNRFERYQYANKDLIINAIEYLVDDFGVMEARSKEVKLRLLDDVEVKQNKTFWQLVNLLAPLVFVALLGLLYQYFRKRKYAGTY